MHKNVVSGLFWALFEANDWYCPTPNFSSLIRKVIILKHGRNTLEGTLAKYGIKRASLCILTKKNKTLAKFHAFGLFEKILNNWNCPTPN